MIMVVPVIQGCQNSNIVAPPPEPDNPVPNNGESTSMLVPYISDVWDYTVYFPQDWHIESRANIEGHGVLDFYAPEPKHGTLTIKSYDIEKMELSYDIEELSQQWISDLEDQWGEITLTDNQKLDDNWDWTFSFNGELWELNYSSFNYLKIEEGRLYTMSLQFVMDELDEDYVANLMQIPDMFKFYKIDIFA